MPDYLASPTCWMLLLGSFILTSLLTPLVIRLARRIGAVDHGGYRKINTHSIPLMGGLAIALPFLLVCLLGLWQPTNLLSLLRTHLSDFLMLIIGGGAIVGLGVYDDIKGLDARNKFAVQIMVAILFCASGNGITTVDLPLLGKITLGPAWGGLLTILWIVGVINAFNLIDGLDGLASGLAMIGLIGLGAIAAINGVTFIVVLSLALIGSLLGFLFFNFHPARIFLGDTGSLFLGFILAAMALMGSSKASGSVTLLAPMLALGLPIFDTLSSMLRRMLRGRSPFVGDRSHTHHRLLEHGYNQTQAAVILYAVAAMCTLTAIISQLLYPASKGPLFAIGLYAVIVMGVAQMNGYLRPRQIMRIVACRKRNQKLAAFTHYALMILNAEDSSVSVEDVLRLGCKELNLHYLQVEFEDDPDFIAFVWPEGGSEPATLSGDPLEAVRVRTAGDRIMLVRYQLNHWVRNLPDLTEDQIERDKLEHQDVMACLAHLFSRTQSDTLVKVARQVQLTGRARNRVIPENATSPSHD